MASLTASAATSLLNVVSSNYSVKGYSTKLAECLQAVKTPYTSLWHLQSGNVMMKLELPIAVADSLILCTLSQKNHKALKIPVSSQMNLQ